ncbi:MAG: hypothetical protein DVB28_000811 [Verrucomicrobia bacterium]|nr:MAG: hypothetical protein DVB28_000811 [Verrucomicrobiota bacterium]
MKNRLFLLASAVLGLNASAQPGLTIYNGRFAVVRDIVPLELKAGENNVRYSGATASLDPSTVILRDPSGKIPLSILEQNYQNDPVNQITLLDRFEGLPVSFLVHDPQKGDRILEGKVIRSGYVPGGQPVEPMIEVDGKIQFELPGRPLFPSLKDEGLRLKPLLNWKIQSPEAASLQAELAYLTQGLEWTASYNLVLHETGSAADINGWITIKNNSGKQFENARIKLMAGDVHRAEPAPRAQVMKAAVLYEQRGMDAVSEKTFDDFHLYTLPRPTTLRDQETKQLEFTRAAAIPIRRIYTYDATPELQFFGQTITESDWGTTAAQRKVTSSLEFTNAEAAPLPAGSMRVYRKDGEQLEFVGEDLVDHTPRNEKLKIKLGNAFDLVGEHKRTNFQTDTPRRTMDESFEIRLRNQGQGPVEITVVEHLARSATWTIPVKSHNFKQLNSNSLEFTIPVPAGAETIVTYTAHYTW